MRDYHVSPIQLLAEMGTATNCIACELIRRVESNDWVCGIYWRDASGDKHHVARVGTTPSEAIRACYEVWEVSHA